MTKYGENALPELPHQHGEAWIWARRSLAGEVAQGYALAHETISRMPDVVSIISAPPRQPERPRPSVAARIQNAVEFVAPDIELQPHASDSQVVSAAAGTNGPEALDYSDDPQRAQEIEAYTKVMDAIDSFRTTAGMPAEAPVDPGSIPVFPPGPQLSAAEQAELDYPSNQNAFGDKSFGQLRSELNGLYAEAGEE